MRKYIALVESVARGCPRATHDIKLNLKNRQTAIDEYHYGPANPDEPEDYWKAAAKQWKISEKTAKTMQCANCAAFDISNTMRECIAAGINPEDEPGVDPWASIKRADLGYCNFLHFKCAGNRSCSAWITGGAVDDPDRKNTHK